MPNKSRYPLAEPLADYLRQDYAPSTVDRYLRDITNYLHYMSEERAMTATYPHIMAYVAHLRTQHGNPRTITRMLYGVKAWYQWLVHTGQRTDHPCRYLVLKDAKRKAIQLQDLFTSSELDRLMERDERFESVRIRNQVAISLLIYQGLRLSEVAQLKVQHIDLQAGELYSKGATRTCARTLKMKTRQVMLFYQYLHEIRPRLLRKQAKAPPTDHLLLSLRGGKMEADSIKYLIETCKEDFPNKNLTPKTIRQSVIANLLKAGKDLRVVQVFAGHKNPSATEQYRQSDLEELKAAVLKNHPLQ